MAADADLAQAQIERDLERQVRAAIGAVPVRRTHCRGCQERLEDHRRAYGICVDCQRETEWHARLVERGAS